MTRWMTMPDDELDATIRGALDWRSAQTDGAPAALGMAWRLAGGRVARTGLSRPATRLLVVAAAMVSLVGIAILSIGRSTERLGPITNGPIVVANALGWRLVDPVAGDETTMEPCAGACPGAFMPVVSADGRSVFYLMPTPLQADGRTPTAPGWSLWRWDRDAETTTTVRVCDGCVIDQVVPSPDGRYVAYTEAPRLSPDAPLDLVAIDARSGREVRRVRVPGPSLPAWDAQSRLLVGHGSGGRERIDLVSNVVEVVGRGLPDGHLLSSPDGRQLVLADPGMRHVELYVVDPSLEHARPLASFDDDSWFADLAWAPDGTAIAALAGSPEDFEIVVIDVATGAIRHRATTAAPGQVTWLPADRP